MRCATSSTTATATPPPPYRHTKRSRQQRSGVEQLEDKWVKQNRELGEDEKPLRVQFNREYSDYLRLADETLSSHSVGGYKTVRNKLIAHNDLRWSGSGYEFYDVKDAGLTIGDERRLLETLQELAHQLLRIVRGVDFSWETVLHNDEERARDFWGLDQS